MEMMFEVLMGMADMEVDMVADDVANMMVEIEVNI